MRQWKPLLIVAIVGGGFGTGYIWRSQQPVSQPHAAVVVAPPPALADNEPKPPGYDPSLVLPPSSGKGVMIDPPFVEIRAHFKEKARLTTQEPPLDGPELPPLDPRPLPLVFPTPPPPTVIIPVEATNDLEPLALPPTVRLPAPLDEPRVLSAVKRMAHRQAAAMMHVNSRDLRMNFEVAKQGPSGIKAVELWGRRSSNGEYECVDRMAGDQPPFATRLGSEGTYEFRLVFVGGTGVKSAVPMRDDFPELSVCLDTTPPAVELLPPLADPEQTGTIRLRWKAEDRHLEANPIRIEYSTDAETWIAVNAADEWLPNTGDYAWKVPEGLPNELHLRIRARDRAGNIGEARSPSKVPVDLTVPEGRISGLVEELPEPRMVVELMGGGQAGRWR